MLFDKNVIKGINFDGLILASTVTHIGSNIGVHIPRIMTTSETDTEVSTNIDVSNIINQDPSFKGGNVVVRNFIEAKPLRIIDKSEHENLSENIEHTRNVDKPYIDDYKPWYNEKVLIFFLDGDPKQCYYTDYKL